MSWIDWWSVEPKHPGDVALSPVPPVPLDARPHLVGLTEDDVWLEKIDDSIVASLSKHGSDGIVALKSSSGSRWNEQER